MSKTGIEYLDYTWNPTHGCSPVSEGCQKCWALAMSKRLAGMGVQGYSEDDPFKVVCCTNKLGEPFRIRKPSRIGVSFMGDLFHEDVPDKYLDNIFAAMALNAQHTFLILTKRPKRMGKYLTNNKDWGESANLLHDKYINSLSEPLYMMGEITSPLQNVWPGVSVENNDNLWRIDELLKIPAAVRFVSVEPMLGEIDIIPYVGGNTYRCKCGFHRTENEMLFRGWQDYKNGLMAFECMKCGEICKTLPPLDWVICGSESGPGATPMKYEWAYNLCEQTRDAGIPFFYKQGIDDDGNWCKMPKLQGITWDQMPEKIKNNSFFT